MEDELEDFRNGGKPGSLYQAFLNVDVEFGVVGVNEVVDCDAIFCLYGREACKVARYTASFSGGGGGLSSESTRFVLDLEGILNIFENRAPPACPLLPEGFMLGLSRNVMDVRFRVCPKVSYSSTATTSKNVPLFYVQVGSLSLVRHKLERVDRRI
jgi:hypothetical protein